MKLRFTCKSPKGVILSSTQDLIPGLLLCQCPKQISMPRFVRIIVLFNQIERIYTPEKSDGTYIKKYKRLYRSYACMYKQTILWIFM